MKISSIARINFTIVALCVAAILFAGALGIIPDDREVTAKSRAALCEAIATNLTYLVSKHDYRQADKQLDLFAKRNPEILSAGLRSADGRLLAEAKQHQLHWQQDTLAQRDGCYVVPITAAEGTWGAVELRFAPLYSGTNRFLSPALIKLILLLIPLIGGASWLHLRKIVQYLDPSQVVPPRVRQTLDSFAEGVVLLDKQDRIVLANEAFTAHLGCATDALIGKYLHSLSWHQEFESSSSELPWQTTKRTHSAVNGATVRLLGERDEIKRVFSVNTSPVQDENGEYQGAMVVLADVTPLEMKRVELADTLERLHVSKAAITQQNEELRYLATRDPLTGCINRRTFFEQFSAFWENSKTHGTALCAMMVDIDFFKSINDNYGHSMGDEVLRKTGGLLNTMARKEDVVCRYGGEEFSILMPGLDLEQAAAVGEAIRIELGKLVFPEFTITASLGVSSIALNAPDPQALLDQADKCLYVAKRNGRNQVVRFDTVPADLIVDEKKISRTKPSAPDFPVTTIPYPAVAALLSALSYRDAQTAAHSTRVATYSALLAQQHMGPREVYVVEMAGLLHDIGKMGVPDAILLKPGKLNEEEWKYMERHDRIGIEIINKAFKNTDLTEIVKYHHARYDGRQERQAERSREQIPLGARILTIADSFDAMVSDRPYRKGMPISEALEELRRCAGSQFDPGLVEQFSQIVRSGAIALPEVIEGVPQEVVLSIGEQIERLVEASEQGDQKAYHALAERLKMTAQQNNIPSVVAVATRVSDLSVAEDVQLQELAAETFELLSVCRNLHRSIAQGADVVLPPT